MTLNQIVQVCNLIAQTYNKVIHKEEYNLIFELVNLEYFKKKCGLPEDYVPGQHIPKEKWDITLIDEDAMRLFKEVVAPQSVDENGRFNIPTGYVHLTRCSYNHTYTNGDSVSVTRQREVEELNDRQLASRRGNSISTPSTKYPVMVIEDTYFQFYPITLAYVDYAYLRLPATPVYAEAMSATTGVMEYDSGNSVQFEWPDNCHIDLVYLILEKLGMTTPKPEILQLTELKKNKGV